MRRTAVPVTVVVTLLCAWTAAGQPASLETIRMQVRAGQYERAWLALQDLAPTPDTLRLEVEVSAHLGKIDRAIESYGRLTAITGQADPAALGAVSRAILDEEQRAADPLTRAESCRALLRAGVTPCRAVLQAGARDQAWPRLARLVAAAALAESNPSDARLLTEITGSLKGPDLAEVAAIIPDLPAAVAQPILNQFVASPLPELQCQGAMLLADFDTSASRQALKVLASGTGLARSAARFSLAQLGDPDQLRAVAAALPRLERADLYRAGRALAAAGDDRGIHALEDVIAGNDPALRLDAAAALARWSKERAQRVIEDALTDPAPHIRARALALIARFGWSPYGPVSRLLTDQNPVVRVRAAGICVRRADAAAPQGNGR